MDKDFMMSQCNSPILVIGFGSQAKSWALNLRDSGHNVHVVLRKNSPSIELVQKLGFKTLFFGESDLKPYSNFLMLTPDHTHKMILNAYREDFPKKSNFIYAHGFSYCDGSFGKTFPEFNHLLLAPKAIASEVRFQYETSGKLGAAYSVEMVKDPKDRESAQKTIMEIAKGIGINVGPFLTSFKEECYADLFSEQSILCSLLPYASSISFKKLREKGVSKEIAYFECWAELKLICDALTKFGPADFFDLISPNALIGGEKAKNILFDDDFEQKLNSLMDDIWSKKFFKEVESTDVEQLRKKVNSYWKKQEIQKLHETLGKELFS